MHSIVSNDSGSEQRTSRSNCAEAQADLGLRCPHMPDDMFSHDVAHTRSLGTFVPFFGVHSNSSFFFDLLTHLQCNIVRS